MLKERLKLRLKQQRESGLYRNPPQIDERSGAHITIKGRKMLNLASNDYLGLGDSEELRAITARNFGKFGSSSSSSRLVSGNHKLIKEAEESFAEYFGFESCLFFPSGYQANLALISTLFEADDSLIFDKHVHASMVAGLRLSPARIAGYRHNSLSHLERRLQSAAGPKCVISESLFSMDGDTLDVEALQQLKANYGFGCIIDEAHAFGALGHQGRGLAASLSDISVGTLGKAFGLFGAFILLPQVTREYLLNFASAQIYTTTLPAAQAASASQVLQIIKEADDRRDQLKQNSNYLKELLSQREIPWRGEEHIIAIEIGDEELAVKTTQQLFEEGIFCFAARYPTVPQNRAILRLSLTSEHTHNDLELFVEKLWTSL